MPRTWYYTMKLVRGRTLSEALRDCHSCKERLQYLSQYQNLCLAVAYAHSQGVIHRDLKPDNTMIGDFGETLLLDWGLAKRRHEREDRTGTQAAVTALTMDGALVGTPAYMSPEQALGELDQVDERSDVWGLGAVLYELLTGGPPFLHANPIETIVEIGTGKVPVTPVRQRCPEAPGPLAAIAERALCRDREKRYASVAELARDLAAYRQGDYVSVYRYSWRERLWHSRNHALLERVILVGIAVLLLLIGAGAQSLQTRSDEAAREQRLASDQVAKAREKRRAAQMRLGSLDMLEGQFQSALGRYQECGRLLALLAEKQPTEARRRDLGYAWEHLGELEDYLGDPRSAEEHYRKALEVRRLWAAARPHDRAAQLELASSLQRCGQSAQAAQLLAPLAALDTDRWEVTASFAEAAFAGGDDRAAIVAARRALGAGPEVDEVIVAVNAYLAAALRRQGDRGGARKAALAAVAAARRLRGGYDWSYSGTVRSLGPKEARLFLALDSARVRGASTARQTEQALNEFIETLGAAGSPRPR